MSTPASQIRTEKRDPYGRVWQRGCARWQGEEFIWWEAMVNGHRLRHRQRPDGAWLIEAQDAQGIWWLLQIEDTHADCLAAVQHMAECNRA